MIRVIIIESNKLIRIGLNKIVSSLPGIDITGLVEGCDQMFELIGSGVKVDVILANCADLVSINQENVNRLLASFPHAKVVILTNIFSPLEIVNAYKQGIKGYLHQNLNPEELLFAIRHVYHGYSYLSSFLSMSLLEQYSSLLEEPKPNSDLLSLGYSKREIEVLELIAQGYTNGEIGEKLFLSKRTVEGHRQNLLHNSGMKNTPQLVYYMASIGALKPMKDT